MAPLRDRKNKDGTVSFEAVIRIKPYPRVSRTFTTKTDRKSWVLQTEAQIQRVEFLQAVKSRAHTFAQLSAEYAKRVIPHLRGRSDQLARARYLAWWGERLGPLTMSQVTAPQIAEGRDALADQGLTGSTINRYLGTLSYALLRGGGPGLDRCLPASSAPARTRVASSSSRARRSRSSSRSARRVPRSASSPSPSSQ
jgi:hypothetical protein